MFSQKKYVACEVKHPPKPKLMPSKVKYHVSCYGTEFQIEKSINDYLEQAVLKRDFDYMQDKLKLYKSVFSNINIEAIIQFIYLQAIHYGYSKEDFNQLLKYVPIERADVHTKINYYALDAHFDKKLNVSPFQSELTFPTTYSETLRELTIRFGAKELTSEIDELYPEQGVTKKRRI